MDFMERFRPDVVMFMIGDNDITDYESRQLLSLYKALIEDWKRKFQLSRIVITQMLPRYGRAASFNYNPKSVDFNRSLLNLARNDSFLWFKFVRFCFPSENMSKFCSNRKFIDHKGVHLTPGGHYILY